MKAKTSIWIMLDRELTEEDMEKIGDFDNPSEILESLAKRSMRDRFEEEAIEFMEIQVDIHDE